MENDNIIKQRTVILFTILQFVAFWAMGRFIGNLTLFIYSLIALFALDVIWSVPILNNTIGKLKRTTNVWFITSSILLILCVLILINKSTNMIIGLSSETSILYLLFSAYIIVCIFDYVLNRKYFFKEDAIDAINNF